MTSTNQHFELIIVDDCSLENLDDIVLKFSDERIKYYRNEQNNGCTSLAAPRNHCIQYFIRGYLLLAGDNDGYVENFLHVVYNLINKYPNVDVLRVITAVICESNDL